jgi:Zn-dependent peptidase ImmA (M78 family)
VRYHEAFGDELPVPIEAIAEDLLGLIVEERELDGVSGLLYPAERRVVVNATEPEPRRRFTLAHEVGHWVCQCLEGRGAPVMCRAEVVTAEAPPDRTLEREANVFAAELLMPEPTVRSRYTGSLASAATDFSVSEEAMHWRLFSFGLLAERPA